MPTLVQRSEVVKTEFADTALADPCLYTTIFKHCHKITRVSSVDYDLPQPQTVDPLF